MDQVRVLGVRVDCLDMDAALERIAQLVDAGGHHLVATVNPEFIMRARPDRTFARVLETAVDGGLIRVRLERRDTAFGRVQVEDANGRRAWTNPLWFA